MDRHDYAEDLHLALADERVARALHTALRDVRMRKRFERLRGQGLSVEAAVEKLRGPHLDSGGRPYYLSGERVRGIVYQKRRSARSMGRRRRVLPTHPPSPLGDDDHLDRASEAG